MLCKVLKNKSVKRIANVKDRNLRDINTELEHISYSHPLLINPVHSISKELH